MPEWLLRFARVRTLVAVALAVLAVWGPLAPFLSVWTGRGAEVCYRGAIESSSCGPGLVHGAPATCVTVYALTVGNTGDVAQREVRVTLHGAPPLPAKVRSTVRDIVARDGRRADPVVDWRVDGPEPVLRVRGLDADVLVRIEIVTVGLADARRLRDATLTADAEGRRYEADPQAAAFFRALDAVFGRVL